MDITKLNEGLDKVKNKIGDEMYALIGDELTDIISENSQTENIIKEQHNQIKALQNTNEALVTSNGNLIKKVQVDTQEPFPDTQFNLNSQNDEHENNKSNVTYADIFDAKGNIL